MSTDAHNQMYELWKRADSTPTEGEAESDRIARLEAQVQYLLRVIGPGYEVNGTVWHPRLHRPPTPE
jgi:hypothetical protein